jgi:hypothetical protein
VAREPWALVVFFRYLSGSHGTVTEQVLDASYCLDAHLIIELTGWPWAKMTEAAT